MDQNIKGNPSALNYGTVSKRPKLKPFSAYGKNTTGAFPKKKRTTKGSKKRPLQYKQNLG